MKRSFILVMLSVGVLTMSAFTNNIPELEAVAQFDESTMISKKLRSAQESMDKGDYKSAISTLNSLLKLSPNHSKAKEMLDQCKQGIKQQKAREEQNFKDACKSGSIDALNSFICRYPNSEYVKSARQRLDDYSMWEIAKKRNTIDSYNLYLQKSSVLAYKEDAQAAIKIIKADQAWSICMNTDNESLLSDFICTYPESPNIGEAKYRLNLLKGERLYRDGFTDMAYSYLGDANLHKTLTDEAATHYAELKEKKTFNDILASSDIDNVRKYLHTLSFSSPYYNDTSNHLALLLGAKLSPWSSEYNMNEALSFAKDEKTKNIVQGYIDNSRRLYSQYKKQQRHNRIIANGGYVKFGIEVMDFGIAGFSSGTEGQKTLYYNLGLSAKLGNYKSPVQFEIGIKPGVVYTKYKVSKYYDSYYESSYSYKESENETFFHMPVYAKLKFNICNVKISKLYVAGICTYNAVKDNNYENDFSVGGGVGVAWKKWDWFALYYKQDIENKLNIEDKYLATSLVYYF